jgi:hypothetical protein
MCVHTLREGNRVKGRRDCGRYLVSDSRDWSGQHGKLSEQVATARRVLTNRRYHWKASGLAYVTQICPKSGCSPGEVGRDTEEA